MRQSLGFLLQLLGLALALAAFFLVNLGKMAPPLIFLASGVISFYLGRFLVKEKSSK